MRIVTAALAFVAVMPATAAAPASPPAPPRPVVFVHGLGANAAEAGVPTASGAPGAFEDLLRTLAARFPRPGVCQDEAQPGRPWDGSPCVFRYVQDLAEAGGDSMSGVAENADKLAREVGEVYARAGRQRVVLVGYSMGGAIIRTYLSLHAAEAERAVKAVVLVDAVTQGSWGFSFVGAVPEHVPGPLGARLVEGLHSLAASASAVNLDRPAVADLTPRSPLFRRLAASSPPRTTSYYTFYGDIRVVVQRGLLSYSLPDYDLPSLGDMGLLPGDPDPAALPELGGQRFTPGDLAPGSEGLDVAHTARIRLSAAVMRDLLDRCARPSQQNRSGCVDLLRGIFDVPDAHTAIPVSLSKVFVDSPRLGGHVTLLDAILAAIGRNQGAG